MDTFNADLHIHSPHSIAVSKKLNLDTMIETCKKKGLNILGTGDILQPEWLKYMEANLEKDKNGAFSYKGVNFVLQTEIEDVESVHEVVFFPNFDSVREVQKKLQPHSKNILGEWGGRPRVNLSPAEIVDVVTDSGGVIGPAHAFTPFKAIFRQNKFKTLEECYQDAVKKISFLELGLSANTDLADKMDCLKNITFLSNSDAHSEGPRALGREYNKFEIERGLSKDKLHKYFTTHGDMWKINDEIRAMVSFKKFNLIRPLIGLGMFDIVFCRNVAIYFSLEDRKMLFDKIAEVLEPDGYLIIGSTESLTNVHPGFEPKRHLRSIFYQLKKS